MKRRAFTAGFLACSPIAASVVPFGIIAAVSAGEAGLSAFETAALSVIVFAGAAQLAALELAKNDAPTLIIIGAALIVNLRFVIYSASLGAKLRQTSRTKRAAMAYLLTDHAFALSLPLLDDEAESTGTWFYFGAALAVWSAWQCGTWLGIFLGARVPPEMSLDFAVALAFIAIIVPHINSRPMVAACAASVGAFLLSSGLPHGLALVPAAVAGISAGVLSESLSK